MTENDLRNLIARKAETFIGSVCGDADHRYIVDTYNSQISLPRGYRLKYTDAWCAGAVSAWGIMCGLEHIVYPEVGTDKMIQLYQSAGRWVEDDSFVPSTGDVIFYDWDDSGIGDNQSSTSHVGLVLASGNGQIKVIEGNMGNRVGVRYVQVNGLYIRGFGIPNYKSMSTEDEEEMIKWNKVDELPNWAKPTVQKLVSNGYLKGDEHGDLRLTETMVRILVINDRAGLYN